MIDEAFHAQYEAAAIGAGVVRLDGWTTLRIGGADRATFLHNMCTNDIRNLAVGDQCEAYLTDVKGKIGGHVIVFALDDELTLVTVPGQAERLIAHLDRYIIREDVQLDDATLSTDWSLVVGPGASEIVAHVSDVKQAEIGRRDAFSAKCRQLWIGGAWLLNAQKSLAAAAARPPAVSEAVWHALRTESGWPLFGVDFDSSHLPQEVSRDERAISFRKGCYLGQETVARIDALGHVNKRIATVKLADEAARGDELFAGDDAVGRLTTVAFSPRIDAWLGLAMVRRGHNEPGAQLTCRKKPAEVIATPAVSS